MLGKFFNTTNERGNELKEAKRKASSQDAKILSIFAASKTGIASASIIYQQMNCPITSIRRSLNTLEKLGLIRRLDRKTMGMYGRNEYLYMYANYDYGASHGMGY